MFCKGKGTKIKSLFAKINRAVAAHAATALVITGYIRSILDNPLVAMTVNLTKTKIDDEIRDKAITALGVAIDALSMTEECRQFTDMNQKLECFLGYLKNFKPGLQHAILIKMASLITANLDGHAEKQRVYDALVQGSYTIEK